MAKIDIIQIIDGLYLGSLDATFNTTGLQEKGITHILTIDHRPLNATQTELFQYKYIHALDLEDTDLLSHFQECFDFINSARENGSVLVHCFAGLSRSATITIAYLMYLKKLKVEEAEGIVRKKREAIKPNIGFMRQLQLFERMGCVIDKTSGLFRKYKLCQLAQRMQAGFPEVTLPSDILMCNPLDATDKSDAVYKCRKCRLALFRESELISHTIGDGESSFDWRSKIPTTNHHCSEAYVKSDNPDSTHVCDKSLFIQPVKWMATFITAQEGKIPCPKCSAKLGSFVWYGEKCPCGAWVAPAFHIQTSKVDKCMPRPLVAVSAPVTTGAVSSSNTVYPSLSLVTSADGES
ncbi:hypothetical protein ACJMK2_028467 [Sinanodonta woodiana]|uniref:Protein-tyrosine-phosphatase n=1 Tax=Sinanodonta woodiana TaxID=1069815 RepID=A0ABD3X795_SINWO